MVLPLDFWYCIAVDSIMLLCTGFYVLYYISNFAHPEDTKWGQSLLFRSFIFVGYVISFA
jgi:putative copper export protein